MLACLRVIPVLPLAVILGAGGCRSLGFSGAGDAARPLAGFEAVSVTGGLAAQVTVGERFSVRVEGDPARRVRTRVEKDTLVVSAPPLDPKVSPPRLTVVLPRLSRLVAETARVTVAAAPADTLEITAREGSTVNVGGVKGGRLVVEGTGGSRVVVEGAADVLACTLSGASRGDARALAVGSARVSLAGASRLDLRPRQSISGEATGASRLAVWSKPKRVGVATRDSASVTYVR